MTSLLIENKKSYRQSTLIKTGLRIRRSIFGVGSNFNYLHHSFFRCNNCLVQFANYVKSHDSLIESNAMSYFINIDGYGVSIGVDIGWQFRR